MYYFKKTKGMRFRNIIATVLAICVASGCKGQTNNQKTDKMSKSIVIFFSHAGDNYSVGNVEVGNTKIVADGELPPRMRERLLT